MLMELVKLRTGQLCTGLVVLGFLRGLTLNAVEVFGVYRDLDFRGQRITTVHSITVSTRL